MEDPLELERRSCIAEPLNPKGFNPDAQLPHGCAIDHIRAAMEEFLQFLTFINTQLHIKDLSRLEGMMMPASFSSFVGEFVIATIPKYCETLAKNTYHNGHPDLVPNGRYPNNAVQYAHEGIEVKASRYFSGWQGHNPEESWLMVLVYAANRPADAVQAPADSQSAIKRPNILPQPFRFECVFGAQLTIQDWSYSGRSGESRRTITASVTAAGFQKMTSNWIYRRMLLAPPSFRAGQPRSRRKTDRPPMA